MGTIRNEVRENYLANNPNDENFLKPFLDGFYVTWARVRKEYNTTIKVFFLSPEDHLKESYGFENEIMLVYAPYKKMEPRTLQAVEQIFSQSPAKGRVETLNYFLISEDIDVRQWLDSYNSSKQESRIIVSFTREELENSKGDTWFVRNKLNEQFFGRDLFDYSLPLTEDTYFFGRQQLIMDYYDSIKRKENKALFGLRKTGKTSFLFKLKRLVEIEGISNVIYLDCKQPHIRSSRWYELLGNISGQIDSIYKFKKTGEFTKKSASNLFFKKIEKLESKNKKICLMFDEIEYISFIAKRDKHWHKDFIDFWQTIWASQSQLKNFSFVISGVNPFVVEKAIVDGIQNPLFGIVPHKYLTGFTEDETRTMIRNLGRRMGLKFLYDSISDLFNWYGGHPLLTRKACSFLNTSLSIKNIKPIEITVEILSKEREKCDNDIYSYCEHVISELKEFYPDEYHLLELLSSGQFVDFRELSQEDPYVKHLIKYGIIHKNDNKYSLKIPVISKYIGQNLAREEKRRLVYKVTDKEDRDAWVRRRVDSIIKEIRSLEKTITNNKGTIIFGIPSFPEADQFKEITVVKTKSDFTSFINICNKCFVESIDIYGKSIGKKKYFWEEIKNEYLDLYKILHKIKVYRNEIDHLELNSSSNKCFIDFIKNDFEGKTFSQIEEPYFLLQQRILEELLHNIIIELSRIN